MRAFIAVLLFNILLQSCAMNDRLREIAHDVNALKVYRQLDTGKR